MRGKQKGCGKGQEEQEKLHDLYFEENEKDITEEERELIQYIIDRFGPLPEKGGANKQKDAESE